jgi:thiol:disulfide interchange protein
MERNVFPRPAVVERFNQMVLAKLYTDRGTPEDDANQKLQQERFGTVALPFYAVLSPDGRELAKLELVRLPSEQEFVAFLDASLQQWAALKSAQPAAGTLAHSGNGNPQSEDRRNPEPPTAEPASFWQPFDLTRATSLRAERRNLIVDWTADW